MVPPSLTFLNTKVFISGISFIAFFFSTTSPFTKKVIKIVQSPISARLLLVFMIIGGKGGFGFGGNLSRNHLGHSGRRTI